jgi:glycosyltransferase involved in cell wall biosynthesis
MTKTKKKSKLSVVLAVYNEEKNLPLCLDSVENLADEIVVVDGSSTDKTVEVAKKYGSKIIETTNKPMFHINKQMAIDAATCDWILQLDADEQVSDELGREIAEIVIGDGKFNGFWIPRKNFFLGKFLKKGGQYPDPVIRLFKRNKGFLPCETVHEQIKIDGEVGMIKNDLIHIADPSFSRYLLRYNRYTTEIAVSLDKSNLKLNPFTGLNYLIIKPAWWFLLTFFRHKGFGDGFPGFVFSFFSSLRFSVAYIKYWEKKRSLLPRGLTSDWQ